MRTMIRTLCCAAAVLTSTGVAGWSAKCVAQTGSRQPGRLPEGGHRGGPAEPVLCRIRVGGDPARPAWAGRGSTGHRNPGCTSLDPREGSLGTPTVALTYVSAGLSHLAATYVFWTCAYNEGLNSFAPKCAAASLIPMVAVPAPALIGGADLGKALGASAAGLGGGAAAYLAAMLLSE